MAVTFFVYILQKKEMNTKRGDRVMHKILIKFTVCCHIGSMFSNLVKKAGTLLVQNSQLQIPLISNDLFWICPFSLAFFLLF